MTPLGDLIATLARRDVSAFVNDNGSVILTRIGPASAHVWKIAVKLPRHGTGAKLLRHVLRAHPHITRWDAWIDSRNVASQALFAKFGFKPADAEEDGGRTWTLKRSRRR